MYQSAKSPISKITPKEIISFSPNVSKEKLVIASCDHVNKHMKFWHLKLNEVISLTIEIWQWTWCFIAIFLPPNILVKVAWKQTPLCQTARRIKFVQLTEQGNAYSKHRKRDNKKTYVLSKRIKRPYNPL